jgi:hypothetical protein
MMSRFRFIRFFVCFSLFAGGANLSLFSGAAVAAEKIPIYFYWDGAEIDWELDLAKLWNFVNKPPLRLNGQMVRNCDDLEPLLAGKPYTLEVGGEVKDNLMCPASSVLGRLSRPQVVMFDDPAKLDRDVYEHLDASQIPWELSRVVNRKGPYTLAALHLKNYLYKNQVTVDVGKWSFQIDFEAMADFDGDGLQEVYCELRQESPDGKIVEFPMILTRQIKGGPINARQVYVKKPPYFKPPKELVDDEVNLDPRYDNESE